MLNDIARYPRGARAQAEARRSSESVVASRWRQEVFEPTVAAVPDELQGRLPAAEVFHQVLEHRWFLSERAGKDVGIDEAVRSYVESELPTRRAGARRARDADDRRTRTRRCRPGGAMPPGRSTRTASSRGTPLTCDVRLATDAARALIAIRRALFGR